MTEQGKIVALIGIIVVAYGIYYYSVIVPRTIKIQESHIVMCAEIVGYSKSHKVSDMTFHFAYKGKDFKFTQPNTPNRIAQGFQNGKRTVMIVFQNGNPNNWRMLEHEEDFNYYNIQTKDTSGLGCSWY